MSPTGRLQRQLRLLTLAFAFAAVAALSFLAGQVIGPEPVSESDLVPASVNGCVNAIKASLVLLDPDSIVAFDAAEIEELRRLSPRCLEKEVNTALQEEYPELLLRLETIGRDSDCRDCPS